VSATHRVAHKLAHVRVRLIVCVFGFWLAQLVAWISMMLYVQLLNPSLGQNVLYVTQISHWALVITCGTAATATWGVITARAHSEASESARATLVIDLDQIELDLARLAQLQPGPDADALAAEIETRLMHAQ
jgi:hypothetical protein